MSQNYNRGLENEYLLPYLEFTESPSTGAIAGGGTTTLTAVATASTGIGYMKYRWYQDDVLSGGITTALSGVSTTRDFTLTFGGDGKTKEYSYKVSAEWVPENSDQIVSHGTPGVGATGVGVGQSITGYSPNGETFSNTGITSVSPTITVTLDDTNGQPIGYNTSAYNVPRNISVTDSISNGDSANLAYQWYNSAGPTAIAGATSSGYQFTPGYVGINTYYCVVSYPSDTLVPSVQSDSITDNATDLTQTIRIEYFPAGGESSSSSSDYKVYSEDVNLTNHPNGFKIDLNHVQDRILATSGGSRNTSTYAWENYYYISFFAMDDNLTVDLELAGATGIDDNGGVNRGGYGGWMVLQGTMGQNKEFVGVAATGKNNNQKPATTVYQLGSVIGISGNGGGGDNAGRGGDGGADSSGESSGGGTSGGIYYQPNTLSVEGFLPPSGVLAAGRASRCPKGSSWYQNRYGACETFQRRLTDPDGSVYPEHGSQINTEIDRGFKMTNHYLINGEQTGNPLATGKGGSGAMGGNGHPGNGGGGGSGYYGGSWNKLANVIGGNDGSSRTFTYGTGLTQTVTTDGQNGYIRIFGRGGSAGNNPIITNKVAKIRRNPSELSNKNGLWLDLTDWDSDEEVLVRGTVTNNSSGHFLSIYLTDWGGYEYNLRGDSDTNRGGVGTTRMTVNENSGTVDTWLSGGQDAYYLFRTHDHSAGTSGVYQGGENQGGGAGTASGGEFDITVHDNGASGGDNNTGGSADMRAQFSIQGER